MITTDRDVFLGAHVTQITKDRIKKEAERRKKSVSELVSQLIEDFLSYGPEQALEYKRSNKRNLVSDNIVEEEPELPFNG